MNVLPVGLSISAALVIAAPLLTWIAVSCFASPQSLDRRLASVRHRSPFLRAGWWRPFSGSLGLWALVCGATVVALHTATSDLGARLGAYCTGIGTLVLFDLAAATAMRRRIGRRFQHLLVHDASPRKLQQNLRPHNLLHALSISWSIKPKTWQRTHIALAIGAMLPLWWHCDLGRASSADLLLKSAAMLLLLFGFLGIAITDLTRWRLISPKFSPRLSAGLIKALFGVHRWLAVLTFTLISIHVLVVLYFVGI